MKKILIMMLAFLMLLTAVAESASLTDGIAGKWKAKDTEIVQDNTINIKKELISYNASSTSVYAPAFSYTYTVTPAKPENNDDGYTVTDSANDHNANTAVVAPVNAGITTGLKVNGGTAGTEESAVGTIAFTNTTALTTSTSGGVNEYNITLDFSGVAFEQPGVYRYKIAETLADSATYAGIAIKDGGSNERYLDVYVDGNLKIYGYVCMASNGDVTTSTTKTNGFVGTSNGQDEYYTYDLVLSKDVENDSYGEGHAFPFTVFFKNTESYTTTYTITETAASGSTGITPAGASAPTWNGVAKVKEGATITYTGIPCGVDVDVYETNDMTGVTYAVVTKLNGTAVTHNDDGSVSWGDAPQSAVEQTDKKAYESTKTTVDTTIVTAVSAQQTLEIVNTLLLISPTGVVVRVAPYVIILAAGIALLLIGRRRRSAAKD